MSTFINLKNFLTLMLTAWMAFTSNVNAATWNGGWTTGSSSGCGGVGRYVSFNHDGACYGTYNMTFQLQRSSGGAFTTVSTLTKVSSLSAGIGDQMYFPASAINQSGSYRVIISGSHITGSSCTISVSSFTTASIDVSVSSIPIVTFNINGYEQYTIIPGSTYANVLGCVPVKLNYTGVTVSTYRFSFKEVTSTGVVVSMGHSFTGVWISGTPTTFSMALNTSTYYEVTLEVTNGACAVSKTSRIYSNPTAPTATVSFRVNNSILSSSCNTGFIPIFYICSPNLITLNNHSSGVSEYQIKLERSSSVCGSYSTVYTSDYISTLPDDLKNLPGTNGNYMQNNTGFYKITITGKNGCGVVQSIATGIIEVRKELPPTAAFKVNGITLPTSCSATIPQFFNCPAYNITMSNQSVYTTYYNIVLLYSTTACGTYSQVYQSSDLTSLPTDLKNLPNIGGNFIQSNPGYYNIYVIGYANCGSVSIVGGFFKVAGAPTANAAFLTNTTTKTSGTPFVMPGTSCTVPYSTQLTYEHGATSNCGTGGFYKFPMESSNVVNANPVGRSFTSFDLSGVSTGTGSLNYGVTIQSDLWDASSTSWINMNYLNVPETYTNISNAPLLGLLAEGDSDPSYGYHEYFSSATNGEIFRITLTVENECASVSQSQIIKLSTTSLRIASADENIEEESTIHSLNVFPNPTNSEVSFEVTTADKDKVNISVYDLSGARVMDVVTDAEATEGTSIYGGNLDHLTSGMYFYQVKVNNTVYTGKLSKK